MIKLIDILENKILVPRRSSEERSKNYLIAIQKKLQQYIKDGEKGDLSLYKAPIESLENLTSVGGYLNLYNSKIKSLGNLKSVGGNLYLTDTPIKSLENLTSVGGGLDLSYTEIESFGNLKSVGGFLYLRNTPISKMYSEKEIRNMVDVKGKIYL